MDRQVFSGFDRDGSPAGTPPLVAKGGLLVLSLIASLNLAQPGATSWLDRLIDLATPAIGTGAALGLLKVLDDEERERREALLGRDARETLDLVELAEQGVEFPSPPVPPPAPMPAPEPVAPPPTPDPVEVNLEAFQQTIDAKLAEVNRAIETLLKTGKEQKLRDEWQDLQQAKKGLLEQAQKIERDLAQREADANRALDERAKLKQAQLDQMREQLAQTFEKREEFYQTQVSHLQQAVAQANGIKRPRASLGYIAYIGNQILDVLAEYKCPCDFIDAHKTEVADVAVLSVLVEPREGVKVAHVAALTQEIQARVGLGEPEVALTEDGRIEIQIVDEEAEKHRARGDKSSPIQEPDPAIVRQDLTKSTHFFISGDTGSGKSSLVNNIICLIKEAFGEEVEIVICDPKFPDNDWIIQGEKVVPQFKGYDRLVTDDGETLPNALDGIIQMYEDVRGRLDEAAIAEISGRPAPARKLRIYVIDEAEDMVAQYGDKASDPIKAVLRVGRSTRVVAIILGQSPMCSDYGMKKANLNNTTRFWLRENGLKGLDDCNPTREQRAIVKAQVYARQRRAEQELIDGFNPPPSSFFALIKAPGRPPFMCSLPKPNEYSDLGGRVAISRANFETTLDLVAQAEQEEEGTVVQVEPEQPPSIEQPRQLPPELQRWEEMLQQAEQILDANLTDDERQIYEYSKQKKADKIRTSASTIKANKSRYKKWSKDQIQDVFRSLTAKGLGVFDGVYFDPT